VAIYIKDSEGWSTNLQQEYHLEALTAFGERVILKRRWQTEDFVKGLVSRCTACADGVTSIASRVTDVYKQAGDSRCSSCYGIGFEAGFIEPSIITYTMADDNDDDIKTSKSGAREGEDPSIQLPHFPRIRQGDMLVRFFSWDSPTNPGAEEGRFVLDAPTPNVLRTGSEFGGALANVIGYTSSIKRLPADHAYQGVVL